MGTGRAVASSGRPGRYGLSSHPQSAEREFRFRQRKVLKRPRRAASPGQLLAPTAAPGRIPAFSSPPLVASLGEPPSGRRSRTARQHLLPSPRSHDRRPIVSSSNAQGSGRAQIGQALGQSRLARSHAGFLSGRLTAGQSPNYLRSPCRGQLQALVTRLVRVSCPLQAGGLCQTGHRLSRRPYAKLRSISTPSRQGLRAVR